MHAGVQRLVRTHERAALAFLDRAPFDNVFLSWLIEATDLRARAQQSISTSTARRVSRVGFFRTAGVLAVEDNDTFASFAQTAPSYRFERMIVGPRPTVERYWSLVRGWHSPPRLVRESQPVLAVDRSRLRGQRGKVVVRKARANDWESVADNSAR